MRRTNRRCRRPGSHRGWVGGSEWWGLLLMASAVSLMLSHGITATAQESTQALSLREAWRTALQNNLTLQQQESLLLQIREEVEIQRAGYLPTVSTNAIYGFTSETARFQLPFALPGSLPVEIEAGTRNRYEIAAAVDQPIFTGFRTRNLIAAVREQHRAQAIRREAVRNRILLQVGQVYYQIQLNQLQQRVLAQAIARADHHLQRVRSFYQAAQATAFDTLEVANRRLQLQSRMHKLANLHPVLTSRLRHLLNAEHTSRIPDISMEAVDLALENLADYHDRAVENRRELRQIASLRRAQSFRIQALKSTALPQLHAGIAYHYAKPGINFFRNEWMGYFTAGLNLRWKVWDGKRDHRQVRKARLEYGRLDIQSRQLVLDIRQQVDEAYRQLQTVRQQIDLHRQLVEQEQERYRITRENYEQGYATSLDLSTAENTLTSAELQLQQDHIEWLQFHLQLQFATGTIGSDLPGGSHETRN